MSRSYKKTWGYTDNGPHRKFYKRLSNKITRKNWNLTSGSSYKKNKLTYDICDYKSLFFYKDDGALNSNWPGRYYSDCMYKLWMK